MSSQSSSSSSSSSPSPSSLTLTLTSTSTSTGVENKESVAENGTAESSRLMVMSILDAPMASPTSSVRLVADTTVEAEGKRLQDDMVHLYVEYRDCKTPFICHVCDGEFKELLEFPSGCSRMKYAVATSKKYTGGRFTATIQEPRLLRRALQVLKQIPTKTATPFTVIIVRYRWCCSELCALKDNKSRKQRVCTQYKAVEKKETEVAALLSGQTKKQAKGLAKERARDLAATSCHGCSVRGNHKLCSACKLVTYCSPTCQTTHWPKHKAVCRAAAGGGARGAVPAPDP